MILMTTVFATLFRDAVTDDATKDYHSIFTTLRTLIDYFLANFSVKDMGNFATSHSILYIVHVTISNIFLLNFLVAILQTVYDIMIRNGDFYAIEY
jgi:Ni/Fe-hydrogenase subunit HybB-like protein